MGHKPGTVARYASRVVTGLVVCALAAAMLHADIAAAALLTAAMLAVLAITCRMRRDGEL